VSCHATTVTAIRSPWQGNHPTAWPATLARYARSLRWLVPGPATHEDPAGAVAVNAVFRDHEWPRCPARTTWPPGRGPVRLRGGPPPGVAEPDARVALSARWYGADPRAAREGLHAFAAAAGLRPARLARPVACTAAALACLVEVPAELDRRPVHLRPAVLRGGEPAGPSARGTIPLGRTRAGREFALAPADFAGHAYVLGPSGTGKTTLLGRLVNGLGDRKEGVIQRPTSQAAGRVHELRSAPCACDSGSV